MASKWQIHTTLGPSTLFKRKLNALITEFQHYFCGALTLFQKISNLRITEQAEHSPPFCAFYLPITCSFEPSLMSGSQLRRLKDCVDEDGFVGCPLCPRRFKPQGLGRHLTTCTRKNAERKLSEQFAASVDISGMWHVLARLNSNWRLKNGWCT